jgi:hypothetical protein
VPVEGWTSVVPHPFELLFSVETPAANEWTAKKRGECVNSVVVATHAALVTLDGEERSWKRQDGDPVEQHSRVPEHIRATVKAPSDAPGEHLLLLGSEMASIEAFLVQVGAERRKPGRGCWLVVAAVILAVAGLWVSLSLW